MPQHCIPLSETLCLPPVSLRLNTQSPLIGQLKHDWTSTAYHNRAAVLNLFLNAKLSMHCANV